MANGRFLSTTIATDKRLAGLTIEAEYLFLKTIPHLDRDGLILADPPILWAKVCPRRAEIMPMIPSIYQEWLAAELVTSYETDEGLALHFLGFAKNQAGMRYNREAASRIDPPPGFVRDESGMFPVNRVGSLTKSGVSPAVVRSNDGLNPRQVQVQVQDQVEVEDQVQDQVEAQGQAGPGKASPVLGSVLSSEDEKLAVKALSEKLQGVGVGLTPYIIDQYVELVNEFGLVTVLQGITAAADNSKQHRIKYVAACIRNIAQGTAPKANGASANGKIHTPEELSNAWAEFVS